MGTPAADDRDPSIRIQVDYDDADDFVGEYEAMLVAGEAFFAMTNPHPADCRLRVAMCFPGLREPAVMKGVVTDTRTAEPAGIVVHFDEASQRALADLVERVRARDPGVVQRVLRILLVEDNPHLAALLRGRLGKPVSADFGVELHSASDGHEALQLLASHRFEIAIVDVYLPVIDGAEVIRRARGEMGLSDMPFIAVSAGGEAARQAALDAGASAFFDKPIRFQQIFDSVRTLCRLGGAS